MNVCFVMFLGRHFVRCLNSGFLKHNRHPADNTIKFLRAQMDKVGCPVGDKFFASMECTAKAGAGFMPEGDGVRPLLSVLLA